MHFTKISTCKNTFFFLHYTLPHHFFYFFFGESPQIEVHSDVFQAIFSFKVFSIFLYISYLY